MPQLKTMSKLREWMISGLLFSVLIISLFEITAGKEHWPFSSYQMYSRIRPQDQPLVRPRLFGVTAGENPREIPLYESKYIAPFDKSRFARALMKIQRRENSDPFFREALRNSFERYEKRRVEHRHDGPALQGMRLYELSWTLDPMARNRDNPDQKVLLAEWMAGDRGKLK